MYILFEAIHVYGDSSIMNYDCMGYTRSEGVAMAWVQQNPEFRCYKYCPKKEIK